MRWDIPNGRNFVVCNRGTPVHQRHIPGAEHRSCPICDCSDVPATRRVPVVARVNGTPAQVWFAERLANELIEWMGVNVKYDRQRTPAETRRWIRGWVRFCTKPVLP